jgi:hypothetical protein
MCCRTEWVGDDCGKIAYGRSRGADVLGDTWHGDKAKCRRCVPKKVLLSRLSGQFTGNTDLIKIDQGNGD